MSKVTRKYQITIPVSAREPFGIFPGSEVDIVPNGKDFELKVDPIEDLELVWKGRYKIYFSDLKNCKIYILASCLLSQNSHSRKLFAGIKSG
ncbi:MAG: AbrB/MazE/SpoVT family DNA-binding domain-containing protein [Planctomycetes bacterium]|nr:AbrB/MazE/SpoVT family DNA-binding domain-containing protein [Planctomycetota bacterium]